MAGADPDDEFLASLDHLVADAVAADAAGERAQTRILRQVAEEEATFMGVALDLAERAAVVVARTSSGGTHRGRVVAVGRDFLVLRDGPRPPALLSIAHLSSLRPEPGSAVPDASGSRPAPLPISLAALLPGLAADRPWVRLSPAGDEPISGTLVAVGTDVVTVRLGGGSGLRVHIRLEAISDLVLGDL